MLYTLRALHIERGTLSTLHNRRCMPHGISVAVHISYNTVRRMPHAR